nr:helix-turn-helix domain-containing protein [Kibdelosporangium phytohabitans]
MSATAGLAGMSVSYLSMIERGRRRVTRRATVESLASALRVSPSELVGKPYAASGGATYDARVALAAMEDALTGWWIGEVPDAPMRPWSPVSGDVRRLNRVLRPNGTRRADQAATSAGPGPPRGCRRPEAPQGCAHRTARRVQVRWIPGA